MVGQNRNKALTRAKEAEESIRVRSMQEQQKALSAGRLQNESYSIFVSEFAFSAGLSENQARFLVEFVKDGLNVQACFRAGIHPSTFYTWRHDPIFADVYEEVKKMQNESLEKLALDLGNGVYKKPLVSAGQLVAYEPIYDTRLLAMILKARMPERYAQRVDVTSGGQPVLKLVDRDTWDAI